VGGDKVRLWWIAIDSEGDAEMRGDGGMYEWGEPSTVGQVELELQVRPPSN